MTRSVKLSSLLVLLLASFLNGCASTNKSATANDANNKTSTAANSSAANTGPSDTNASSTNSDAGNNKNASAANSSAASNDQKKGTETYNGPVFKNGAPPASYPTVNKKDPWESMNRS